MICVVLGAKKLGMNPDNVATPVAASLGDLTTLALLAFVSKIVFIIVEGMNEYHNCNFNPSYWEPCWSN